MYREIGTRVQHRNGYIHVKVEGDDGKPTWVAEGRRVWELKNGDLEEGDRVFHVNGDRTDNRPGNLAKVHFNNVKFVFLKRSRVLYTPPTRLMSRKPITPGREIVYMGKR